METVSVIEIARILNISPTQIRRWDGYDEYTDTVVLTEQELEGLWQTANKTVRPLTYRR